MRLPAILLSSSVLVLLFSGCATSGPTAPAASASEATPVATDSLAAWLAETPKPEVVPCSVDKATAPEVVERFDALSTKISALYQHVYTDATQVAATPASALSLCSDSLTEKLTQSENWKDDAQKAITAHYQEMLQELEEQRKALVSYTDSLRKDAAITNLPSKLQQTSILVKMGADSVKLGRQLQASEEGARLILRRRIEATLGK